MEYTYRYFYKVINLVNGKFYYGIHRTNRLDDGYLGSGTALKYAFRKYGKENFRKVIFNFFDSDEELVDFEERVVTEGLVDSRRCYNLVRGGRNNIEACHRIWTSPEGEAMRAKLRNLSSGYNNPDFKARWKPIYDSLMSFVIPLVKYTTIPDPYILKQIRDATGYKIKWPRIIKYYESSPDLDADARIITKGDSFFSYADGACPGNSRKTTYGDIMKEYKAFIPEVMDQIDQVVAILLDETISDSMLFNDMLGIPSSRRIHGSYAKYLEYLGILQRGPVIKVNVRHRRPDSQRRFGKKTTYVVNQDFSQEYRLIGGSLDERYKIGVDGIAVSVCRV